MSVPGKKDKETGIVPLPKELLEGRVQTVKETLNPNIETEKAPTIEDMLEERRKAAQAEKTDAQKMQRYYALTDAMKALGKMGGAAVGGAIGGDVLAGATPVEYKPNRGYLDAIENAKKASDRIRSIDDAGFQLAVSKQQRDEERAYQTQKTKEEREYQAAREAKQREWDKELLEIKAEIEKAALEGNYKLKEQLETKMATMQQQFKKDMAAIEHRYNMTEKSTMSAAQQAQIDAYNKETLAFDDGTAMRINKGDYAGMRRFYKGKTIGGVVVDDDNFDEIIRANPQLARDFMKMVGSTATTQSTAPSSGTTPAPAADYPFPSHISQVPPENMNKGQNRGTTPAQANGVAQSSGNGGYSVEDDPFGEFLAK